MLKTKVPSTESFSGYLLRSIGLIDVEEVNNLIIVKNIYAPLMLKDLKKVFNTKIAKHMIYKKDGTSFTIHRFYAIELYFIIQELKNTSERVFTSYHTFNRILDGLLKNTWLKNVVHYLGSLDEPRPSEEVSSMLDYSKLSKFKTSPLTHQMTFLERYDFYTRAFGLNGYYLAGGPGSGKTLAAMFLYECIKEKRGYEKIIVIPPLNAVDNAWLDDPEQYYKKPMKRWTSKSGLPLDTSAELIIFHHNALDKMHEVLNILSRYKCMVVIDEGHFFNNVKSARTELLISAVNYLNCKDVLWLSGTPIKAVGTEAIPFLCTVFPEFGNPYKVGNIRNLTVSFKKLFGSSSNSLGYLLSNRLGLTTFKVDKSKYMMDEPLRETITVKIPNGERYTLKSISNEMIEFIKERINHYKSIEELYTKQYFNCLEEYENSRHFDKGAYENYLADVRLIKQTRNYGQISEILERSNKFEKLEIEPVLSNDQKKLFRNVKSAYKYVELKIRGEALGRILGRRRMECQLDMVKHLPLTDIVDMSRKKTILFTSYVEVVDEMMEMFKVAKYNPIAVYGKTNSNLPDIIDIFTKDERINPLCATLQSLSTAVRMTMASTVVFTNDPFRSHEREQAEARVHRIGQDGPVTIIDCTLDTGDEPNVNTRSRDILQWSKEQIDMLMGKEFGIEVPSVITVSTESYGEVDLLTSFDALREFDLIIDD